MRYASGDNMLHRKTLNLLLPRFVRSNIGGFSGLTMFDKQVLKKNQEGNTSVNKLFS
jgi:hypothetical protein